MKTYLKKEVDILQFLSMVGKCRGQVHFRTPEGDDLVLNSTLSQYFFAFLVEKKEILETAVIICEDSQDRTFLQDYLVDMEDR